MNSVEIIGNVGKIDRGDNFVKLSIADTYKYNETKKTNWFEVVLFKNKMKLADYINVGDKLYVEGRGDFSTYENKNGQSVKSFKVILDRIEFLGAGKKENSFDEDDDKF